MNFRHRALDTFNIANQPETVLNEQYWLGRKLNIPKFVPTQQPFEVVRRKITVGKLKQKRRIALITKALCKNVKHLILHISLYLYIRT